MDPLIEIPRGRWEDLATLFRSKWPKGSLAFNIIKMQLLNPALTEEFNFKVYCPKGDMNNGMVAITSAREWSYYQVMPHPMDETKAIEEALLSTKLVDWNRNILFPSISPEVIEVLQRIKEKVGIKVLYDPEDAKAITHILPKDSKLFENVSCPPDTYIASLTQDHIDLVDKTWAYYGESSYKFFETLMNHNLTYVLYSKEHKPLAWVTQNESGALTHLFTLEEHRKKGYAEVLIKHIANKILQNGQDVLAFTVGGNTKPQKLFDKLGFQIINLHYWVFVCKAIRK